jgi:hypothetical protein
MDSNGSITKCIEMILSRSVTGGGFAQRPGSGYRPDATAWGILALSSGGRHREAVENSCRRLAASQLTDGRVPVAEGFDTAYWPTPLAALAWKKAGVFSGQLESATKFLLGTSGLHGPKEKNAPTGHDTAIRGWSWIENTHSWIEPTSMAILALKATGNSEHDRVHEAVRMILDRQLSSGGWNYGNTTVFNQELLPMPEHTGQALCALSGSVQHTVVEKSINYSQKGISNLQTPLSLCWSLFGLTAWSIGMKDIKERIVKSLFLQEKYGAYDTTLLAQLLIAYNTNGDFLGFIMS